MRRPVDVLAASGLAEVCAVTDEGRDRRDGPRSASGSRCAFVEIRGECMPGDAGAATQEEFAQDRRRLYVGRETSVLGSLIPERWDARDMDAASDGSLGGDLPVLTDALEFQLGYREHHRAREAPDRGRGIEGVTHGDEYAAGSFEPSQGYCGVGDGAREAVEGRDRYAARLPLLNGFECGLEPGTLVTRPGLVEVGLPGDDAMPLRGGGGLDSFSLHVRGDEALPLSPGDARDADVSDQIHRPSLATTGGRVT